MTHDELLLDRRAKVLVIGLGRSGWASIDVLRARGTAVFVTDENIDILQARRAELAAMAVAVVLPDEVASIAGELTMAVLSPGVPLSSAVVQAVQAAHIPVLSEIEVAYRISKAPIVAVTGTKGKTTTTALTGSLFRAAGRKTYVGGNIGNALIAETAVAPADAWVIAEVSSFQLESISSFKPRIAGILNISPDHLDRYRSMEEYAEAKYRVFANQANTDTFVGNLDNATVAAFADGEAAARIHGRAMWFSLTPHPRATVYVQNHRIVWLPATGDQVPVEIMPIAEVPLLGEHNIANVLAALLICLAAGLDPEALRAGVRSFQGLPHRLEVVAELEGIRYIDDSKATNPGSVAAALDAMKQPTILIAGGKSKGTDFAELAQAVRRSARAVVLIGEAADEIAAALTGFPTHCAATMADAVAVAGDLAQVGDTVLLSPGCASFDMFSSAEARGDAFVQAVTARMRRL